MNLTEKMALDCGVKISKPHVDFLFMPIKEEKFIIFDTRSKYENGLYDYYSDVFELIKPYLAENNISCFQFATDKSYKLACNKCFIILNKKQESYIISKAQLLISNENYTLHLAAACNVKSIGLYSVYSANSTRPIWNKDSQIILESHRDKNLPAYGNMSEKPKTVNFISPYVIAKNILDSLNIQNDLHLFELVNIGQSYSQKIIEIVPDFVSSEDFLKEKSINLRLDYINSLTVNILNYWMAGRKVNVITNKDINVSLLLPHRSNILLMTVMISDDVSEKFLKQCKAIGLKIKIFCNQKDKLEHYRFKFLNWDIEKDFDEERSLKNIPNLNEKSKFISSKVLISKGKQFSCKANYLANKHLDNRQEHVILSKEFEEELEFFKIYNEREESASSSPNS